MSEFQDSTLPLTAAQSGVWFAQQLDPANPSFRVAECLEIHGPVDRALFEEAVRRVDGEMRLPARFVLVDGEPRQVLGATGGAVLGYRDFAAAPDPWAAAQEWIQADVTAPFDPFDGPFGSMSVRPLSTRASKPSNPGTTASMCRRTAA